MSTVFMAVECFKCSSMQVKQRRKKSSSKWRCVICNEKQSVRKVYSQGFMAKDVRAFVQNFNMCRQQIQIPPNWTGQGGDLCEGDHYSTSGKKKINYSDKQPTTSFKRVAENQLNHDNIDPSCVYQTSTSVMSKFQRPNSKSNAWKHDGTKVDQRPTSLIMKPVSKWNNFIDDDLQLESTCSEINNDAFETKVSDEIVQDEVHPDFL